MKKRLISFGGILTLLMAGKFFLNGTTKGEERTSEVEQETDITGDTATQAVLQFAGQRVPIENPQVRQRLERELKANHYWHPMAADLAEKASRYFAIIRPILKKNGIPDDFKYVPLIESGFTNMVSYSGAAGPWQIMPSTARHFGLEINSQVDERYHVVLSTEAACKIIKKAYGSLKDWTLVAASFNKGLEGVRAAMKRQKVNSYYKLHLNSQAQRYVFRILAVKEIMEHPAKYGFRKRTGHFYYSMPTYRVRINKSIASLATFAKRQGISLKTLRLYNPWLKSTRFDNPENKTYFVEIPKAKDVLPADSGILTMSADHTAVAVSSTSIDSSQNFIEDNTPADSSGGEPGSN